jgi:hypothetical protein
VLSISKGAPAEEVTGSARWFSLISPPWVVVVIVIGASRSLRNVLKTSRQNLLTMLSTPCAFVDYMILLVDPDGE